MRSLKSLGIALILCSVLTACGDDSKKPPAAPAGPPPVHVGHPTAQHLTEWDTYTGRFRAENRVEIRARVSGYLTSINFKDGDRVKKGDLLFVIDQRPFELALEHAQARVELAKQNRERLQPLINTGAISQQELDQADQELKDASASVKDAELNLTYSEIRAPIAGRISRHLVDVGNLVDSTNANTNLLTTIVADDPIYFYFDASEQDLLKYIRLDKDGKRESSRTDHRQVLVELQDEKDFTHAGVMDFIDNELDNDSGTIEARAILPNPDGTLVSGMFGRARIAGSGEEDAILVPDDVIGTNQTQKFVYVVGKDNKLEARPVELGQIYENNLRIIHSGLTPDDTIVMGGLMMLQPGMPITPKFDDAKPADGTPAPDAKPADAKPADGTVPTDVSKTSTNSPAQPSGSAATPSGSPAKDKTP